MRNTAKAILITTLLSTVSIAAMALADEVVQVELNKGHMVKLSRAATSVVVADPNTADVQVVSPRLIFVHGKRIGETSITAVDGNDDSIFEGTIEVTHNLSSLERNVKRLSPDSDVTFKTVDNGLVISGSASSVQESEAIKNLASAYVGATDKVVSMVTTAGGDQVMLQVKIVEMARTDLKTLGLNLQGALSRGNFGLQLIQGADIALDTAGVIDRAGGTSTNILGSYNGNGESINSLVDALETQGLATVLAEPSLTTTSGKSASFLAGGQYPIPVRDNDGGITVQYQQFGVSLNFTPVVMNKGRMSILVAPEVSSINSASTVQAAGFNYPILDTRRAQATVELGSGQTFAMAGLLKSESSNSISKLPGAGDLPILGTLFRSNRFQNNQTELVILVTPYLVHPVSDKNKMQTPLTGFKQPTDTERVLKGSMYQQQEMSPEVKEPAGNTVPEQRANPVVIEQPLQAPEPQPEPSIAPEPIKPMDKPMEPDAMIEPEAPPVNLSKLVKPAPKSVPAPEPVIEAAAPVTEVAVREPAPQKSQENTHTLAKAVSGGGFILE